MKAITVILLALSMGLSGQDIIATKYHTLTWDSREYRWSEQPSIDQVSDISITQDAIYINNVRYDVVECEIRGDIASYRALNRKDEVYIVWDEKHAYFCVEECGVKTIYHYS